MKSLSLKNRIDISFGVVLLIFAVLVYATYNRARAVTANRKIIVETYTTNTVLEKILSNTIDIETGVRGYTITGKDNFLDIYNSGKTKLKMWQDSLQRLKKNSPDEHPHIEKIYQLIEDKKAFTDLILETGKNKDLKQAAELVGTGKGKLIMDSIRDAIAEYQSQQVALLSSKLAETDQNVNQRNINFFLFAGITLILIFLGYRRIRRSAKIIMKDNVIQKTLTDELAFQNRQLNDFANITSHNMRSSAANMTALISMVEEDSTVEEYWNIFSMLKKVAQNLNDSLNELIEVIRVKKSVEIQKEIVTFEDVFTKVTETLQGDILTANATITSDFSAAQHVAFSKVYLESTLQNLIGNAMKYKSPDRDPVIKVYTEVSNGQVVLHVKDNGLGIDLKRHGDKVFGMYQMFHKHPDAKGIGLFLTKAQIENLDGKISVSSDGHSGTTFSVRFAK
ncbi:sensor histidine kinase [Flavobacterium silvaticum]|uniref:histidine kinase n=1 Tax=Flavobacterium silvaticum TaxID=1852020 RepID=A0A972JKT0_9FLAO|nr:CHASE3 domain-containing protein [Flavobacterium silvaticum]NMH29442.1 hypothetical protein [Flavobacterium silvaticum]